MKVSIVNSSIRTAALIALAKSKSFEIIDATADACSNADEIKKLHAHHHNDEFSREFKLRQKSIDRKKQKKPARGGGKP
jgi:hypothetical protein